MTEKTLGDVVKVLGNDLAFHDSHVAARAGARRALKMVMTDIEKLMGDEEPEGDYEEGESDRTSFILHQVVQARLEELYD